MKTSTMAVIRDVDVDHASGLAFDEAMALSLGTTDEFQAMLRLYNYANHCILVGRFQRLEAEVDLNIAREKGAGVNRRPTGGGAILMGEDQLGVAFSVPSLQFASPRLALVEFAGAICGALAKLGIQASLRGKNDIEVRGKKIAGLGLFQSAGGLLLHASLLSSLDVELMLSFLRIPATKLGAHGVSTIAERVTTLEKELGRPIQRTTLERALVQAFETTFELDAKDVQAPRALTEQAEELRKTKYTQQEWLFDGGRATSAEFVADCRSGAGTLTLVVANQGDVIKSALVTGDFLETPPELIQLEELLRWSVIDETVLEQRIAKNAAVAALVDPGDLAVAICGSYRNNGQISEPRRIGSCYIAEERVS